MKKPNYKISIVEPDKVVDMFGSARRYSTVRDNLEYKISPSVSRINPYVSMTMPYDWMSVQDDEDFKDISDSVWGKTQNRNAVQKGEYNTSLLTWPPLGVAMLLFEVQVQPDLWVVDEFAWLHWNKGRPVFFNKSDRTYNERKEGVRAVIRQLMRLPI